MSNRAEIMAEIERLDEELRRITQELDALRRKVEPARSGRTQAFPSPISSKPAHAKSAPTSEIPETQPSPSTPARTATRTLPPSTPATAPTSNGASTGRRVASPAIGLDAPEPVAANQQQRGARRDSPPVAREVGRYGYVSDKPKDTKGAQRR